MSNASEVREAAGRLRRVHQWDADIRLVADYVLAEHAGDDELPIDDAWFASIANDHGFLPNKDGDIWLEYTSEWGVSLEFCVESISLPHIKTRGDLRLLCRALDIPLEPIGQEQGK